MLSLSRQMRAFFRSVAVPRLVQDQLCRGYLRAGCCSSSVPAVFRQLLFVKSRPLSYLCQPQTVVSTSTFSDPRRHHHAPFANRNLGKQPVFLQQHQVVTVRKMAFSTSTSGRGGTTTTSLLRLNKIPNFGTNTQIVCTIGPSTDSMEKIQQLVDQGMSVARLNFSHNTGDYSPLLDIMNKIRQAQGKHADLAAGSMMMTTTALSSHQQAKMGVSGSSKQKGPLLPPNLRGILIDTKGPEIRTGPLPGNAEVMEIPTNATVTITTHSVQELPVDTLAIQVDYKNIAKTVPVGGNILLDDGLLALQVTQVDPDHHTVTCTALNAGPIKKNKGVNLPGMELDLPALTEKDKQDLKWGCEHGADFVAASFIRTAANVRHVHAYLDRCIAEAPPLPDGSKPLRPLVISKIESKEGVDNFDEILSESDGIMVARGDLGVEIPYSAVFAAQRMMVSKCNEVGKPVIVATQMLDSMMRNPRPTRAEVTDVGTAVMDGADAVMLSGETAAGKYPIESLKAMASVAWEADQIINKNDPYQFNHELHSKMTPLEQELNAIAASSVRSAKDMKAKFIVLITMTGRVARAVARHRPSVPVFAFCTDPQAARKLQLHRSVIPIMLQSDKDPGSSLTRMGFLRAEAIRTLFELGFAENGDRVIMIDRTAGREHDMHEYSHNMKVVTLKRK